MPGSVKGLGTLDALALFLGAKQFQNVIERQSRLRCNRLPGLASTTEPVDLAALLSSGGVSVADVGLSGTLSVRLPPPQLPLGCECRTTWVYPIQGTANTASCGTFFLCVRSSLGG